jgi:hypothetical protein
MGGYFWCLIFMIVLFLIAFIESLVIFTVNEKTNYILELTNEEIELYMKEYNPFISSHNDLSVSLIKNNDNSLSLNNNNNNN